MVFSWLPLWLLTAVWTTAFYIYEPPSLWWILFITGAVICSFAGFRKPGKSKRTAAVKNAFQYCGLILLAQGAVFPFYYILAARHHSESLFASIAAFILNGFGVLTVCEGNLLYIDTALKTLVYASTWEKVGLVYFILFAAGGMVILLLKKARPQHYAAFFSITFLYVVLRYVFLIMLYTTYSLHSLFWERTITFTTLLPYILILGVIFKNLPPPTVAIQFKEIGRIQAVITGTLAFLLVLAGVSFFGFRDLGQAKPGRLLVDEYHSDWEWTTDIYDEQWFGERSGYNYYCFFNYLDKFYQTDRNLNPIDGDTLKDVDVFIMKTPTKPFTDEEAAIMVSFVEEGGGLYLIGDHTNVFGTGVNLNQIAKTFGLTFNYDCTYELTHGSLSEYDAPTLIPHPVVHHLPHFLFASSNTLSAKWQAEEIMIGYGLKNLQADYSQKNFFPADTNAATVEFGLFLQSAGVQYGKGRVLAFTDSTVFSNFWMFMPGKPELLLGSIAWLNRENLFTAITPREMSAIFLAVMIILNLVWGYKSRKSFPGAVFVTAGITAFLIGSACFHITGQVASRIPEPIKPMVNICFEREYSRFELPDDLEGFLAAMNEQLNTFYVWTQRLDYFPAVKTKLLDALQHGDLTVMAKPSQKIKNPQKILDRVSAGAKLIILDNTASGAFSNNLLQLTGLKLVEAEMETYANYGEIEGIPLTSQASAVVGGHSLIQDPKGNSVLSIQTIGDGLIAVFSDPDLFYNYELGDVSANLTDKTNILTNVEFKMLKALLEGENYIEE